MIMVINHTVVLSQTIGKVSYSCGFVVHTNSDITRFPGYVHSVHARRNIVIFHDKIIKYDRTYTTIQNII